MKEVYKASGLGKWFDERWKDISRKDKSGKHPPCGASADKGVRAKDSSKKYPKCVPASKAKRMSKKQKQSAIKRKRKEPNKPGKPDFVKTDVQKENWEKWKPRQDKIYPDGAPSNNSPINPEGMAGAISFEKNRKQVLSQLREVIRDIVIRVMLENDTVPGKRISGQKTFRRPHSDQPAQSPLQYEYYLKRLFKDADDALEQQEENKRSGKSARGGFSWGQSARTIEEDIEAKIVSIFEDITTTFWDIMKKNQVANYADLIDELAHKYPRLNKKIEHWEFRQKQGSDVKLWSKMASSIEAVKGATEMTRILKSRSEVSTTEPRTKSRPAQEINLPQQSQDFIRAVGDYRNMVMNNIQNPQQRQTILDRISDIQFDPEIPEQMKQPMMLSMIRNVLRTRRNVRSSLNESYISTKIKNLIILSVLKEQGIYG